MEDIYENVQSNTSVKTRPSTNEPGPRSSEASRNGPVTLSLVLLSVLLLAGLIGLSVYFHGAVADLSTTRTNVSALTEDRDQLKANVSALTEDRDQLKANVSALTEDRDQLKASVSALTEDRDQLKANVSALTEERNRLQKLLWQKRTCPAGWTMSSCSCYFLSSGSGSWTDSRDDCRNRDAHLVVIDSAEEQTFLSELTKKPTWIGLSDLEEEGTWKWVDGKPVTLNYWAHRQPDNGGGDPVWGEEDCATIRNSDNTLWNDLSCSTEQPWACEKEPQ